MIKRLLTARSLASCTLGIASATLTQAAIAAACSAAEYHQFDFWIGEWDVHTADGKLAGTNRIEREYDGCVVHERYVGARGYSGESLNTYDSGRKVWHQTWVDNQSTLLLLGCLAHFPASTVLSCRIAHALSSAMTNSSPRYW